MWEDIGPEREEEKSRARPAAGVLQGGENNIFGNAFYHNMGSGKFEEISDAIGVENYWPWGPSVGDLNADGWPDIFIASSMNFPFRYGINSVMLNDKGKGFRDAEFILGVEPRRDGRTLTPWFDVNCAQGGLSGNNLLTNDPCEGQSGVITVMAPLGSRSAVIFDLDNDGALDIVTNDFNSAPQVLVSNLASRAQIHWAKIVLNGARSNRNGLGATVRVTAAGRTYTKYNDGKSGYLSQSVLPLYFGLDDATAIDRVEVTWPSGKKQVLSKDLKVNSVIRITEPK
jgi:hypothetical protein